MQEGLAGLDRHVRYNVVITSYSIHYTKLYDEFFNHELVMFKPGYFHRDFIDNTCKEHKLTADISFETNLLPMILRIVKHEYAITALLELVTDNEPDVQAIPFQPPVYLDLALAWRKEGYLVITSYSIHYTKLYEVFLSR